jgi:hypothetical protein
MDQKINSHRSSWLAYGRIAALSVAVISGGFAVTAVAQDTQPVTAADSEQAKKNLELFDKLDFEAWNNRDWDLFRELHAKNVKVAGFGQQTENIEEHLAWAQAFIAQVPDSKIDAHPIRIGAATGPPLQAPVAAPHRRPSPAGKMGRSSKSISSSSSPNSKALQRGRHRRPLHLGSAGATAALCTLLLRHHLSIRRPRLGYGQLNTAPQAHGE